MKVKSWTEPQINAEKARIKQEVQSISDAKARLEFILEKVHASDQSSSESDHLPTYIYIVSALVHQSNFGGLSDAEIARLAKLGHAVLHAAGATNSRRLAFLFSDLHLALCHCYRTAGNHWRATWEQHIAMTYSSTGSNDQRGVRMLADGIGAQRLGDTRYAMRALYIARDLPLTDRNRERCWVELIRTARLSCNFEEAKELIAQTTSLPIFSASSTLEITWESLIMSCREGDDYRPVVREVTKGGAFNEYSYIMDAFMLSRCLQRNSFIERYASVEKLCYNSKLQPDRRSTFYVACKTLETCYRADVPTQTRLRSAADVFCDRSQLLTIDKELLVLAGIARWLSRNNFLGLAAQVLEEYASLSAKMTLGKSPDVLGTVGDLLTRPWYVGKKSGAAPHWEDDVGPEEVEQLEVPTKQAG